jgi:predicted aldo/keto reductase-like oxidoreductase
MSEYQIPDSDSAGVTRRTFLGTTIGAMVMAGMSSESLLAAGTQIQYRTLGHTGENVSVVGLGGYHIGSQSNESVSIRIIRSAIDNGINFLDNCWDYNNGASEERMGKALRDGYRKRVFLMTKIDGRDKKSAAWQIDQSLKRLQTDHVDLMQFHEIIRMNDPDRIFAPGGAMEAMIDAKKAGKVRYIGFTGHKSPDIHLKMLHTWEQHGTLPDTVQMPLNVMDAHFNSFEKKVLPELVKRNIGVIGMKSMGDKVILQSKTVAPIECLHYAMNLPTSVVVTGCDSMEILSQALNAARSFRPLTDDQLAALLKKTSEAGKKGDWEKYKTSDQFDGTGHNPEWLSEAG